MPAVVKLVVKTSLESYDQLLIATGASPISPDIQGADAIDIFEASTLESGLNIHQRLDNPVITAAREVAKKL